MTPKEKAEELVKWFLNEGLHEYGRYQSSDVEDLIGAKFSTTKVVDEILNHHSQEQGLYRIDTYYWQEVKREINTI
jgi:hypothetical protein